MKINEFKYEETKEGIQALLDLYIEKLGTDFFFGYTTKKTKVGFFKVNAWQTTAPALLAIHRENYHNDEEILAVAVGMATSECLVFTKTRLLKISGGITSNVISFHYKDITEVSSPNNVFKKIELKTNSGEKHTFKDVINVAVFDKALNFLNKCVNDSKASSVSNEPIIKETLSDADELEKFSKLKDQGIISEDEFQAKKKEILGL